MEGFTRVELGDPRVVEMLACHGVYLSRQGNKRGCVGYVAAPEPADAEAKSDIRLHNGLGPRFGRQFACRC